jgi:Tol biopolymer transport system component
LVRPDGTGDHPLTPTDLPGEQFHPDWSHDGTRIAFSVADDDGTRDIWVVGADGANARRVVDCSAPCAWTDDPAWSPDDGVLVFARVTATNGGPDGEPTVETIDIATGTTAILYTGQPIEAIFVPRWAPDGHRLVLEIDRFASARIDEEVVDEATVGIIDSEDATPVFDPLVPWSTKAASPDWSPMDDQIVFAMPADPGAEPADLHLIDADGADDHVLTDFAAGGGWAIQPSWTPDGARITFTGEDIVNTQANVAMIGADGTGLTRMRFDGTGRTHPRLRPTP